MSLPQGQWSKTMARQALWINKLSNRILVICTAIQMITLSSSTRTHQWLAVRRMISRTCCRARTTIWKLWRLKMADSGTKQVSNARQTWAATRQMSWTSLLKRPESTEGKLLMHMLESLGQRSRNQQKRKATNPYQTDDSTQRQTFSPLLTENRLNNLWARAMTRYKRSNSGKTSELSIITTLIRNMVCPLAKLMLLDSPQTISPVTQKQLTSTSPCLTSHSRSQLMITRSKQSPRASHFNRFLSPSVWCQILHDELWQMKVTKAVQCRCTTHKCSKKESQDQGNSCKCLITRYHSRRQKAIFTGPCSSVTRDSWLRLTGRASQWTLNRA